MMLKNKVALITGRSATNKAFERYFQPRRAESVKVVSAIKELQKKQAGKVIKMQK